MTDIRFTAMPTATAEQYRGGVPDSYGLAPEREIAAGSGLPCRHCLAEINEGEAYLVLAYRPFPSLQPYAETGPIFLHAEACEPFDGSDTLPEILTTSPDYILRGYGHDDRIVYGTGAVTLKDNIETRAAELLARDDIAYVHVRSARNNCYQCRIDRA